MIVLLLAVEFLLLNKAEPYMPHSTNLCSIKYMDGWEFFMQNMTYVMLKRTYSVPGGINDSMCVMAPYHPRINLTRHVMNKTFTYRNMSSTYKLFPNVSFWPIGKLHLEFRSETPYISGVKPRGRKDYNYVGSSILMSWFGYSLPAPQWHFIYCDQYCAVVRVLSETHDGRGARGGRWNRCEQWIRFDKKMRGNKADKFTDTSNCDSHFEAVCDTTSTEQVYNEQYCASTL
ncbi:uncharacterized protein LOC119465041 isoform X1 [Dermacentor silvarum]|uniref:uncharacterized protein LOC119465041 isoform X1 n=1 Tax=Dermacentor silvarum TaxID=543639 RepID=UPI0018994290|nr:uncharacterized protein LOC119465041 isoform X1 [Dermacentor silvarum]